MSPSRRRSASALLLGLLAPVGMAVALAPDFGGFGNPTHGQRLFVDKGCVRCHAVRGAGGRIGPDLGRKTYSSSYYEIASILWDHSQGMSRKMAEYRMSHPVFREEELADLISFLHFLNYFDEPGDVRAGKALFRDKQCIHCHRVGDEGGDAGPALDAMPRDVSPLRIAEALWNHGPKMVAAIEAAKLAVPKFEGNEIIDLFAYIRSQGQRGQQPTFQSPGDPKRGEQLFEEKSCSTCHALFGTEAGVGPDLGRVELRGSVTQIAGRMWNHWPKMAQIMNRVGMNVPEFRENDLLDLFAYIYVVRYQGEAGDAARGRAVFESKGCAVCHGADGAGKAGPALKNVTPGMSQDAILQMMWNHAPKMGALLVEQDLAWSRLGAQELADLLAFLTAGWPEPEAAPGGR